MANDASKRTIIALKPKLKILVFAGWGPGESDPEVFFAEGKAVEWPSGRLGRRLGARGTAAPPERTPAHREPPNVADGV